MVEKPKLLVISSVFPFPRISGQQQRVYYKLKALRKYFHITFLSFERKENLQATQAKLASHVNEVILLPSIYSQNVWTKVHHLFQGMLFTWRTGLKFSNYLIGELEFSPKRLDSILTNHKFACVLFEYWHSHQATSLFRARGSPCVLDMHNILWQSYIRQLSTKKYLPKIWKKWAIEQYKDHEERAWRQFDALITINQSEYEYICQVLNSDAQLFCTPMGVDLNAWAYSWRPASPTRVAYYGGLGSRHNQRDALICYHEIMPRIWEKFPEIELWLVGSNPPKMIKKLEVEDPRVRVTGFVKHVQDVLSTMSLILCPWSGTYGFRSRLVEAMSLGVPVIATPDTVYGMDMEVDRGLFLENTPLQMAERSLRLLSNNDYLREQSLEASRQIEENFGFEATYGRLASDLYIFVEEHKDKALRESDS